MKRVAVLEGSVEEFDLRILLQVVSLGRQMTGVELVNAEGLVVGSLLLKSGKLLDAYAGRLSGLDAVQQLVCAPPRHDRFTVFRTERPNDVMSPLGSVADLLLRLAREPAPLRPKVVLEGTLADFDLLSIMQVLGLGRQCVEVELRRATTGAALGSVIMKGGMVLAALAGNRAGLDALRSLMRAPKETQFCATQTLVPREPAVGSLSSLALRLDEEGGDGWGDEITSIVRGAVEPHVAFRQELLEPASAKERPKRARTGHAEVVRVTSPTGGAGKTTVALNLAVALARRGERVVLIDGDNNGILAAINATARFPKGLSEVFAGSAKLEEVLAATRIPSLRLLPSGANAVSAHTSWPDLLRELRSSADLVIVDGGTRPDPTTHPLAMPGAQELVVVPAEPVALRTMGDRLEGLSANRTLLGVVVNMLDYRAGASVAALQTLMVGRASPWVFDIPIARSSAFLDAAARGVPIGHGDPLTAPTIAWVFEMLAGAVLQRLGMVDPRSEELPLL